MSRVHPSWLSDQPTVGLHPSWLEQPSQDIVPTASGGINRSWLGEFWTGMQRTVASAPSQALSAGRASLELGGLVPGIVGDVLGAGAQAIAPAERAVASITDVIREYVLPRSPRSGTWEARGIAGDIGEAIPQLSAAAGAGMALGPAGPIGAAAAFAGTAAAPVVGQTFQDAMKEHGDPERASLEAAANGAVTAMTSMLPGVAILRKVPGANQIVTGATRRVLGRIGIAALAEGGQEAAEQVGQAFAEELVRNDRALTMDLARELLLDPERLNEYLYAGTLGAVLGGGARAAVEAPTIASAGPEAAPAPRPSRPQERSLTEPTALEAWVQANPDKATELASVQPSRAEFERLGVPGRLDAEQRAQIVEDVRILNQHVENSPSLTTDERAAFAPPANYSQTATTPTASPPKPVPPQIQGKSPFPDGTEVSRFRVIQQLGQDFDVAAIRRGKIDYKGAAGVYKAKPHVIRFRSRYGGDLGVAVHEIAHHLANTTDVLKSASPLDLADVAKNDYDQARLDPEEGFSEYLRYLLVGDDALSRAPTFHSHFMAWIDKNPQMREMVGRARAMIDQVRRQDAMQQARNTISTTGRPQRAIVPAGEKVGRVVGEPLKHFWRLMVRPFDALLEAEKAAGLDLGGESPYMQAIAFNNSAGRHTYHAVAGQGIFSITDTQKRIGDSMASAMSEVELSEWKDFSAFWTAIQAQEVWAKNDQELAAWQASAALIQQLGGIPIGSPKEIYPSMSRDVADGVVASVQQDPARYQRFLRTQQRMTEFNNNLLRVRLEVGNITQSDFDKMTDAWKNYAPLIPVREARSMISGMGRTIDMKQSLRRRKGGDYEILDPVLATMAKTSQAYQQATTQQVFNALVEMHDLADFKGLGDYIEELPSRSRPNESDGIFVYRRGGVERVFQVNKDIYDSLRMVAGIGINQSGIEKVLDWLRFDQINQVVRAGATRFNPSFIVSNIARDFVTQIIQTENNALRATVDLPATVSRMMIHHMSAMTGRGHDAMVALYDRTGGNLSGYMSQNSDQHKAAIKQVMKNKGQRDFLGIAGWVGMAPFKAITTATDGLETAPRLAEFTRTMERLGHTRQSIEQGKPVPLADWVKATVASKDVTTDFSRGGLLGRRINRYVPFFTAQLLGTDKFFRTLKEHPTRTMARLSPLIIATVLLWAMKRDDDEYEEQPDWLKYGFWSFDTNGDGRTDFRIPRPHDWGWVFFSSIEATLDAIYREDPQIIKDYLGQLLSRGAPNLVPTPLKTGTEAFFNWDLFRNQPILNQSMLTFEAADQYRPETTLLMRAIGKQLNMSPAMMEHIVNGLSGGGYSRYADFVETFDIGRLLSSGVTLRNDYMRSINDFYQESDRANRAYQSSRIVPGQRELGDGDQQAADASHRMNWYAGVMADLRRLVPPDAERNDRYIVNRYINGLARHALGRENLRQYPNPFTADELPDSVRAIINDARNSLLRSSRVNARTPDSLQSKRRAINLLRDITETRRRQE